MISDEDLQISNYIEGLSEEYRINFHEEISKDDFQILLDKEEIKDKIITNAKIKDDYIIINSVKLKNELNCDNFVTLNSFELTIIKTDLKKDKSKNQKININIKGEKTISKNNFYSQNYYFFDFISFDKVKNYLLIYIFDQLHVYKIYIKDDMLKYNKIKMKKFDNMKVIYLGTYIKKNKNILEIGLLLKPKNIFNFIPIDTNDKNQKLDDKNYSINKGCEHIFSKFKIKKSYFDKYILTDKKDKKKEKYYIIYKDDNNNEILGKEIITNSIWGNDSSGKEFFFYLYSNIEDKMYFIAELPQRKDEENYYQYLYLGIYSVVDDNDKFNVNLIQQIKIKNKGGKDKFININLPNIISIVFDETLLYLIHLDQKGSVDNINEFQLNKKKLNITRYIFEKSKDMNLFLFFIEEKIEKIYFSKIQDIFEKLGKCSIEYKKKVEEAKENAFIETKEVNEIKNVHKKEKKNKKKVEKIKHKNSDENEEEEDDEQKYINNIMKDVIEETIKNRMEYNLNKLEKLKKEKENKFEIIKDYLNKQNIDNEKLEAKINKIYKAIQKLNEMKNNSSDTEEEEEEIEMNRNYNKKYRNFNKNKNQKNNNINNNNINNNNQIQFNQMNNYRQMNTQHVLNQYNMPNQSILFMNNNKIPINDPRIIQIYQQQQQRNLINQGNFLFQNLGNNNYQ